MPTPSPHQQETNSGRSSGESQQLIPAMKPVSGVNIVPGSLTRDQIYALLAVCTMSIGSHFAMYQLGPLKSRLHREMNTSNAQFSLLIAAFNLNSTWTPLVAGLFVAKFGTAWSSIGTTGCILAGQIILFIGISYEHLITMTLGLFIFGLGVTPLAVVQETLVSRLSPSKHIGISLALGLVSGKMASFVSSLVSLPLAEKFGDQVPFGISVILCLASFVVNLLRLGLRWGQYHMEDKEKVDESPMLGGIYKLGDVFWVYMLLNIFSGMIWSPFLHLSANLVKEKYGLTDGFAAAQAALFLSGALILYPITGFITDRLSPRTPKTTFKLIFLSSLLTLSAYTYLTLPSSTFSTPMPGMILFALGHGMATLLMVILVPRLLPTELVPLGLGLHKSMEMSSSAISQTLSGVWLDATRKEDGKGNGVDGLLGIFWTINALQLGCAVWLWILEARRRRSDKMSYEMVEDDERLPMNDLPRLDHESDTEDEEDFGSIEGKATINLERKEILVKSFSSAIAKDEKEKKRSKVFLGISVAWIILVWVVFLIDAYVDLM